MNTFKTTVIGLLIKRDKESKGQNTQNQQKVSSPSSYPAVMKMYKKQWQSSTASVAEHTLMVLIINHLVIPGLTRNHSNAISLILHLLIYLFLSRAGIVVCSYTQNLDFCPKIAKQLFQSVSNWKATVSNCYWESWLHLLILLEGDTTVQVLEHFPQSYLTQSLVWVNHIIVYTLRLANEWRKQI